MKLELKQITIDNFKGIRHAEISINPGITRIEGANGAGKTTIADAYMWALMGKDAAGNAPGTDAFREKPLGPDGTELHNLETAVTLVCTLDGAPFTLRRVQAENWVKTRGKQDQEYKGNVSTYFVNEVPVKQAEYNARIAEIASPDMMRYISIMGAFNAAAWLDRRKILMSMADPDIDKKLFLLPEFADIGAECTERGVNVEMYKKILQGQLRDLNNEIKLFPARIDEATRALPDIEPALVKMAETDLEKIPAQLAEMDNKLLAMRRNSSAAERLAKIASKQAEADALKKAIATKHTMAIDTYKSKVSSAQWAIKNQERARGEAVRMMERYTTEAADCDKHRAELRKAYIAEMERKFSPPENAYICPYCGQAIPEDMQERTIEEARSHFNAEKESNLKRIAEDGAKDGSRIDELQEFIADLKETVAEADAEIEKWRTAETEAAAQVAALDCPPDYSEDPRIAELQAEIEQLQAAPMELAPDCKEIEDARAALADRLDSARAVLAKYKAGEETQKRIEQLKAEQRKAGNMAADTENKISACDIFAVRRADALEESINRAFPSVRWKLFNQQINGGIAECCMCMIAAGDALVPYGAGETSHCANTAARLHADAEIIAALQKQVGAELPLFFDGAERVNRLPEFPGQLVALAVSDAKELVIE